MSTPRPDRRARLRRSDLVEDGQTTDANARSHPDPIDAGRGDRRDPPSLADWKPQDQHESRPRGKQFLGFALAILMAYLTVGFLLGFPGPGALQRYSYFDLAEAARVVESVAGDGTPDCDDSTKWRISHLRARILLESDLETARTVQYNLKEQDLPMGIVDIREARFSACSTGY